VAWAPDYIDAETLADFVHTDVETDRVELMSAISSACRAIDEATYRQFGSVASETRVYTPRWSTSRGMWVIECDDFTTLTKIELDTAGDGTFATEVAVSSGVLLPLNAAAKGRVYERVGLRSTVTAVASLGKGSVRLTSPWGWPAYPETIVTGAKLQASRVFNRRNSPYGVAGSPDQGSEVRLLARLDPDVLVSVRSFKRRVWLS
jgi:hypothetical protein